MKNKIVNFAFLFALFVAATGCVKTEFDQPTQTVYTTNLVANTTIAELKAMTTGAYIDIPDNVIIKGTVISDDKYGNFYKKLVIQDSTAGIEIGIDQSRLYSMYPEGTLVYVNCKGLKLGKNHEILEIVIELNGHVGRLPISAHPDFIFPAEGGIPIVPKVKTIAQLGVDDINTLVTVKDVEFLRTDTAKNYADPGKDANRTLTDYFDNMLIVRTSAYADFAYTQVPKGNGTFTGVFSVYNTDFQIFARKLSEVNMAGDRIVKNTIFSEDFVSSLGSFSAFNVLGSNSWSQSSYSGQTYAKVSGNANGANEDWLVSPKIDLSTYQNASMVFTQAVGYFNTWDDLTVWVSSDYDGTSSPDQNGTWTQITGYTYPVTGGGNWTSFTSSGGIYLTDYVGKPAVYIAFKYICGASNASTWEVASLQVSAQQ